VGAGTSVTKRLPSVVKMVTATVVVFTRVRLVV
jgi:hypothetical protein